MISYCNIASDVRKSVLDSSIKQPTVSESTRDFLNFRVLQWQRNLPPSLHFGGVGDKLDESKETRGEYKLRLMLYLRANQMRTLIYRRLAVQAEKHRLSPSSANVMADVAQDTLRVLVGLARDTTIYHAQHKTFNHFLETALSSLLLIMSCEGAAQTVACLEDVVAAIELVQQLSKQSPITRRLGDKLQGIQDVVRNIQAQRQERQEKRTSVPNAQSRSPATRWNESSTDVSLTVPTRSATMIPDVAANSSTPDEQQRPENCDASEHEAANVIVSISQEVPPTSQPDPITLAPQTSYLPPEPFNSTQGTIPQLDMGAQIDPGFELTMAAQFLDDHRILQFPELGDIMRDYDYFAF